MVRYGTVLVVESGVSHIGLISAIQYPEVDFGIKTEYDTLLSELKASNKEFREFSNFNKER